MTPDSELLHRFVAAQSNADFTELVRRHIDVVYHAALRRTIGRTDLAADITQEVFILLARKAVVLQRHQILIGWLYTTTRNTANSVMRAERRRQQREQEAHAMNSLESPVSENTHLRQELDHVLDQLSGSDREAILLRFFQSQDYRRIGETLGLNEEAARKRVDRALDRLRERLVRRGITSTATALATLLSGEAALAAPAGLAATVANTAFAACTSASLTTFVVAKFIGIKSALGVSSGLGILGLTSLAVLLAVSSTRHTSDSTPVATPLTPSVTPAPTIATEPAPPTNPPAEIPPTPVPAPPASNPTPQADLDKILPLPDNTFADDKYHLMGKLPDGWSILKSERWGKLETTISLRDPEHPAAIPNIYYQMFTEPMQPVDTNTADAWLRKQATYKAKQRIRNGSSDYVNGELLSRTIGGQPAVSWTATYTRNGEPWAEYLTRVYSPDCTLLFTLRAPAADLPAMTPGFENVILTTTVPRP